LNSTAKKISSVVEFLAFIETERRAELIEGEIIYKATPSAAHSYSQAGIAESLAPFRRKSGGSGPGGWWIGTEIHVIYEGRPNGFLHDLAGWRRDRHAEKPEGKKILTKPDWVCEILSANRSNDLVKKKWVLHEHRVEYIWMVDLASQILSVLRWSEKGYTTIADVNPQQKIRLEPFQEIEFDIKVLFGEDPE
jgi:Uma2 family endonuclease